MKVLLITPLFQPEPNLLKGVQYVKELVRRGVTVQVLTGFPNYPYGKLYPGYKMRWFMRDVVEGVEIVRIGHLPSHDSSGVKRALDYISFAIVASVLAPFKVNPPDVIHIDQGPATLILPALIMKILFKARILLEVSDLWPDSVASSGMLASTAGMTLLHWWCRMMYNVSDAITVLSRGYKRILEERGVPAQKIQVILNWCDEEEFAQAPMPSTMDVITELDKKFNIIYAGTMGRVQALDAVIRAASILREELPSVHFIFIGSGSELHNLELLAAKLALTNVQFISRQPPSDMARILARADVLLVHLKSDPLGSIGIPQKTQAYLASGKPILVAMEGDAKDLVLEAKAGISCSPEQPESIADGVRQLYGFSNCERERMGMNGRRFYYENMSFAKGVAMNIQEYDWLFCQPRLRS